MKELNSILGKIMELTNTMETEHPELYQFLDEDPMTLPLSPRPEVNKETLEDYLQSLQQLLEHHLETHINGKGPVQRRHIEP